jgi:hypothetical protein
MDFNERLQAATALIEEADLLAERTPDMDRWVKKIRSMGKAARKTGRDSKYAGEVNRVLSRVANVNRNQSTKDVTHAYVTGLKGVKRAVDAIGKVLGMKPAGDYPPKEPPRRSELQVYFGPDINKSPAMVMYGWVWEIDSNTKRTTKSGEPIFDLEVYID